MAEPASAVGAGGKSPRLIVGSRAMQRVVDLATRVANTRATVLITGETGVGKELVASLVHRLSPRREHPMVVLNCHGVPVTLLESELFGHERGAFTGAHNPRAGVFERADRTTLLLDEVGDIPAAAQAKLLRVLQERRFARLGGTALREADVRIIATTQHDLRARVARNEFREDLFYRLNVFPVQVPPLRARREEIPTLARHFLEAAARRNRMRQSGLTEQAVTLLFAYAWPGNVRQLMTVIERALLLSGGAAIDESHLPPEIVGAFHPPAQGESVTSLRYAQRLLVARVLHENEWNLNHAANALSVSTHVLRQMISSLDIRRQDAAG